MRARLQIDQRLVVNLEFFIGERLAQIQFEHAARLDRLGHLVAEEAEGATAVRPWHDTTPYRRSSKACQR